MKGVAILLAAGLAVFSTNAADLTGSIGSNGIAADATQVQDTMVLGKLYFVNIEEGKQPVMTALSLSGNRCGSEMFNSKPCSADGIRSVFELDEWIEFHPQADAGSGLKVMVFAHKEDQGFYLKDSLDDETPGYAQVCELNKDPDDETNSWGSFYLRPEEFEPGFYDFVFICGDKVLATMLTRFYKPDELFEKSDSDLEELMSQSR